MQLLENSFILFWQNVQKCCGTEYIRSGKMAAFERLSTVHVSSDFYVISIWIWTTVPPLMHPNVSYILINSHVNIPHSLLQIKLFVSPL